MEGSSLAFTLQFASVVYIFKVFLNLFTFIQMLILICLQGFRFNILTQKLHRLSYIILAVDSFTKSYITA